MQPFTITSFSKASALLLSLLLLNFGQVLAVKDETNQDRYEKPAKTGPESQVPGFLINLGPTGARGILNLDSFTVKYIFPKSPAHNILQLDDEIIGANGRQFSEHTFGGTNINHGMEGPIQDLGLAIEDSEGEDGNLTLKIKRGSEKLEVTIQLEPLGRFEKTFPHNCEKTELLKQRAYQYLSKNTDGLDSQGRCVAILAMLASNDSKVAKRGEEMALEWNKPLNETTWAWHLGFQSIVLAEYYLLTKDKKVLKTLTRTMELLELAQWRSPIDHINIEKMKNPAPQAEVDRAQNLYNGGFGHAPYATIKSRGGGGYGPMQWPTCLALISWQLADECGIEFNRESPERSYQFLNYGTTVAGKVAYGGEFTLNNGVVDPERWKQNGAHKFSHKSGLAYIVHMLSEERDDSGDMMKVHLKNIDAAYKDMADGHACGLMGFTWGLAGVFASDNTKLKQKIANYYKAYFNMARCHGSDSYVVLPNRDYADGSYYRKNIRNHTTASMAYIYSFSSAKLRVQGTPVEATKTPENDLTNRRGFRKFTNSAGDQTFEGTFVSYDEDTRQVQIRMRNGQIAQIRLIRLSKEDREYIRNLD